MCGFPPLRSLRAGGTVLAVVAVGTAASLRGTSVVAEQPLENRAFAVETWSLLSPGLFFLLIPAHPPVYRFGHFPFSLALLFHRWLDVIPLGTEGHAGVP